jgi:hypothetical protein
MSGRKLGCISNARFGVDCDYLCVETTPTISEKKNVFVVARQGVQGVLFPGPPAQKPPLQKKSNEGP